MKDPLTPAKKRRKGLADMWIQSAVNPAKKGALHLQLGIPENKTIPVSKLNAAAKSPGLLGKRARLVLTLKKLHGGY